VVKKRGRMMREDEELPFSMQAARGFGTECGLASEFGLLGTVASSPQPQSIPLPSFAMRSLMPQVQGITCWQDQNIKQLRLAEALPEELPPGKTPKTAAVPCAGANVHPALALAAAPAAATTWQTPNQLAPAAVANHYILRGPLAQAQLAQVATAAAAGSSAAQDPQGTSKEGCLTDGVQLTQCPLPSAQHTLRNHLQALQTMDPECVLTVRNINRLGLNSPSMLKVHFSSYGSVVHVFVAYSHVRPMFSSSFRVRPSNLGFLVMAVKEDAAKIMQDGTEHTVSGVDIKVQRYEKRGCIGRKQVTQIKQLPRATTSCL